MAKFGIYTTFMAENFQANNICDKMNTSPLWRDKPSGKYSQGFLQYSLAENKLTIPPLPKSQHKEGNDPPSVRAICRAGLDSQQLKTVILVSG